MKYSLIILLVVLPFISFAQERGVGIRLGEPLSITYKDFLSESISIEGMIGVAGINGASYYQKDFESNPPESNSFYISHSAQKGISFNVRSAYHEDITDVFGITDGYLLAYGGIGIQLRSTKVTYTYADGQTSSLMKNDSRTNFDFGPETFIGTEYYFDDVPISVFGEVGLFLELIDRIGHIKGQGGIGVRYIF
ncbi:hypothetical protein LV84_03592 [Algoriphagus ratkowskyi]|uniref:Outer membrane protein with beta-barrel domain n=1 Tax=Algoriphagus ratkowskyi TaxID=57028 RepID=A0A2W7QUA0_9BACT|nr:hypothetical protein [Algoriphagus ratkowskyi]PZX51834.1 hypothetical protein LV84_03592 [Algoriphagus ratkowskyi]TXD76030.1 hypothetical protein ESW18_18205 [Algoriphagus ratkowskyi]